VGAMADKKNTLQFIWGVLLVLTGIGLFFRIPQLMPGIKKIEQFAPFIYFIYFCFYLVAVLLIAGGARKVYTYVRHTNGENSHAEEDVK
jgi:uncharacterized membrane protein HdeD (DUF308 family)